MSAARIPGERLWAGGATGLVVIVALVIPPALHGSTSLSGFLLMIVIQLTAFFLLLGMSPLWSIVPVLVIELFGYSIVDGLVVPSSRLLWTFAGLVLLIIWSGALNDARMEFVEQEWRGYKSSGEAGRCPRLAFYLPGIVLGTACVVIHGGVTPFLGGAELSVIGASAGLGGAIGIVIALVTRSYRLFPSLLVPVLVAAVLQRYGMEAATLVSSSWLASYIIACIAKDPTTYAEMTRGQRSAGGRTGDQEGTAVVGAGVSSSSNGDMSRAGHRVESSTAVKGLPAQLSLGDLVVSMSEVAPKGVFARWQRPRRRVTFRLGAHEAYFEASEVLEAMQHPSIIEACAGSPERICFLFDPTLVEVDSFVGEAIEGMIFPEDALVFFGESSPLRTITASERARIGAWLRSESTGGTSDTWKDVKRA
ncbi:hypothetical protein I6B53_10225 [Schaalia sp. 19OD2882]|uniref:hypothetical protein n=1 Tax=Schaalia sp. 19OD2882 TaxID=2794089 RepID=UPI001C1F1A24|nr:hypothetical protein [Schaalia sp. 19OD2882]QWW19442.1 hypothetical protein I6B53_10225 [Schaalia sp. 19OD2882]